MQFIFEHNASSILSFLQTITQFIKEQFIAERSGKEQLLNRCKFIITELCTNGIKHSGKHESEFNVYTSGNTLVIERIDYGAPLHIQLDEVDIKFPLPQQMKDITISEDDIHHLGIRRIDDYTALLYVKPLLTEPIEHSKMSEHFGFTIICHSADSFSCTHNPTDGRNLFKAVINLT